MLNELITWVLNTYLGKYLEDFNPAQLSIALVSGELTKDGFKVINDYMFQGRSNWKMFQSAETPLDRSAYQWRHCQEVLEE